MTATATAIKVTPTKTTREVIVQCPYCGRKHTHGWPCASYPDDPGPRVAHCRDNKGSYTIDIPDTIYSETKRLDDWLRHLHIGQIGGAR